MYTPTLVAFASLWAFGLSQSTSSVLTASQSPTARTGTDTVSAYSAHPPSYTPPAVNTATMSEPILYSTVIPSSAYHNSTITSKVTASNYTIVTSARSAGHTKVSSVSSGAVATSSTGPVLPISTTNAAALRKVASTGLALIVAGSVFAVL